MRNRRIYRKTECSRCNARGFEQIGGRPSDYNAHPHTSQNGKFAVVHNGIVENYLRLKETYLADEVFTSETDTEVVAHMLEKFYNGNFEETVVKVLEVLEGAYALVMICADEPDKIIACRKDAGCR